MSLDVTTLAPGNSLAAGPKVAFVLDGLPVASVAGAVEVPRAALVDGALQTVQENLVTLSGGERFIVLPGNIVLFDAGAGAFDLEAGETRSASLTWTDTQGTDHSVTVVYGGQSLRYAGTDTLETTGAEAETVTGTFHQTEAVDVIGALFEHLDSAVPIDLDSLLDVTLVDIDTTFVVSFDPTNGYSFSVTDNRDTEGLVSGLGTALQPAVDGINSVAGTLFDAIPLPVTWGPTFDVTFGLDAHVAWDVDLPTLGKTSVNQPVSLSLYTPQGPVANGATFAIGSGGLVSYEPTVVSQTIGLGDITLDLSFAIDEFALSGLGFKIGTKDLLGLPLEGLAAAEVKLNAEFDVEETVTAILEAANLNPGQIPSLDVSLSFDKLLAGMVASDTDVMAVVQGAVAAVKSKDAAQIIAALGELRDLVLEALEAASGDSLPTHDLFGTEVTSVDLVDLAERAAFGEFDSRMPDGTGVFRLDGPDGTKIDVTAAQVQVAMDLTGTEDVVAALAQLFGEEGYAPFEGLTLEAALPFGNIEEIQGWGGDIQGPQTGTQRISVEQVTTLAGVSLDFEQMMPELARLAVDLLAKAGIKAANAQPYLIPIIAGAALGGQTAISLALEDKKTFEDGFSIDASINPAGLIAEILNPVLTGINAALGTLSAVNSTAITPLPLISEDAPDAAVEAALFAMRDTIADALSQQFDLISTATSTITSQFDAFEGVFDGVSDGLSRAAGTAGSLISEVNWFFDQISEAIGAIEALLRGVGINLGVSSLIDEVLDGVEAIGSSIFTDLQTLITDGGTFVSDLADEIDALPDRVETLVSGAINDVTGMLIDFARGFELALDVEFDLFEFLLEAGLDVVQVATFNPDDVTVSYSLDGVTSHQLGMEQQAEFIATGALGDALDGQAVYSFSGDVDYDYRLRLNIDPSLTIFNTDVSGAISVGGRDLAPIDFDYSAVETTRDFDLAQLQGVLGGNADDLLGLFDDALVEVPLQLFDDIAGVAIDSLRDSLGVLGAHSNDLPWNEVRLFSLDGVGIEADQFTRIVQDFSIELAGGAPDATNDLASYWMWESASGFRQVGDLTTDVPIATFDGSVFRLGEVTDLERGRIVVKHDGNVWFIPDGDFRDLAQDEWAWVSFDYTLADGSQGLGRFRVRGENDAPEAAGDAFTVRSGEATVLSVLQNDSDVDTADTLSLVSVTQPGLGTAEIVDGALVYTADPGAIGTDTLTYTVQDAHGATDTAQVTIQTSRDAPMAADYRIAEATDGFLTFDTRLLQGMPEGTRIVEVNGRTNLIGVIHDQDAGGRLRIHSDGTVRFSTDGDFAHLAPGQSETITFNYRLTDGSVHSGQVTVEGVASAPQAQEDISHTGRNQSRMIDVLANDTDPDSGDMLSLVSVDAGDFGTAEITTSGQILFTPRAGFSGRAVLTYEVQDSHGLSDQSEVSVFVHYPSVSTEQVWSRWGSGVVTQLLSPDGVDGNEVRLVNGSPEAVGHWQTSDQGILYRVMPNGQVEMNTDGLEWLAYDAYLRSEISVHLTGHGTPRTILLQVRGEHGRPEAMDDLAVTAVDTPVTIDVLANDHDDQLADQLRLASVSAEAGGTARITDGKLVFTPDAGFEGLARVSYTVTDDGGFKDTDSATAYVEVGDAGIIRLGAVSEDAQGVTLAEAAALIGANGPVTAVNGNGPGTHTLPSGLQVTLGSDGQLSVTPGASFQTLGTGQSAPVYLELEIAGDTHLASLEVRGVNDAPTTRTDHGTVVAGQTLILDVLANDSAGDTGDTLRLFTPWSQAGQVRVEDGQLSFTPDADFHGEARIRYLVIDESDVIRPATAIVMVDAAPKSAFAGPTQLDVTDTVSGTFRQLGGVDVGEALVDRLADATGFDLNDLLDFTLIDIDTVITAQQSIWDGFTFDVAHAYAPTGVLAPFFDQLETTLTGIADEVGDAGIIDLGALALSPEITAKLGLDMNFGWDIDLATLGKTAWSQPVSIDLTRPDLVVQGSDFTLSSHDLRVLSPRTVSETVGLGSAQVFAGLDFFGTEIGAFGYGVASSDFGPFELDGLFTASAKLNRQITLDDVEAFAERFIKDVADAVANAAQLPFSASAILDTLFAIDLPSIVQSLFSDAVDWSLLTGALDQEKLTDKLTGIIDFLAHLTEVGQGGGLRHTVGETALSAREIYDLSQKALFGEHDLLDADGDPAFVLDGTDGPVTVKAQVIHDSREFLGIDANIDLFVGALNSLGFAPADALQVKFDAPVGNVEEFEGFADTDSGRDTETRDELGRISVSQTSRLLDVSLDFETLGADLFQSVIDLLPEGGLPPGLMELSLALAASEELQNVVEDGVTAQVDLHPKALVLEVVNGFIDVFSVPAQAFNGAVSGVSIDIPQKLTADQLSDDIDTAIDQAAVVIRQALGGIEEMFGAFQALLENTPLGDEDGLQRLSHGIWDAVGSALTVFNAFPDGTLWTFGNKLYETNFWPLDWYLDSLGGYVHDVVRHVLAVEETLHDVKDQGEEFTSEIIKVINDIKAFDASAALDDAVAAMAAGLKAATDSLSVSFSTETDFFSGGIEAGLDLIQTAHFDPDQIRAVYTYGGDTVEAGLGDTVSFSADGAVGTTATGEVEYLFSGDVAYDYRIAVNVAPVLTFFENTLNAQVSLGDHTFDLSRTYALMTTEGQTSPLKGDGLASQFDEALIELDFDIVTRLLDGLSQQISDQLGLETPPGVELGVGEILLFTLDDIPLDHDRFESIKRSFDVQIVQDIDLDTLANLPPEVQAAAMRYDTSGGRAQTAIALPVFDPDGDALSLSVSSGSELGTFVFAGTDLYFTPRTGLTGTHEVTVSVSDGLSTSDLILTLSENVAPTRDGDLAITTGQGQSVEGTLDFVDPDGDAVLHWDASSLDPAFGTFVTYADGRYTLQLTDSATGTAVVQVTASDGITDVTRSVTVTAEPALVRGTDGDDTLTGTAFDNRIEGLAGADDLSGAEGDDTLIGGAGDDTVAGDAGADLLIDGTGNDVYRGGDGPDRLTMSASAADVFAGLAFADALEAFTLTRADDTDTIFADIEQITLLDGTVRLRQDVQDAFSWSFDAVLRDDTGTVLKVWSKADFGREMVRTYDNGVKTSETLVDTGDAAAWRSIVKTFAPDGALTREDKIMDTGVIIRNDHVGGQVRTRTETDAEGTQSWQSVVRTYDAAQVLIQETFVFDDGRIRDRTFDTAGAYVETLQDGGGTRGWMTIEKTVGTSGVLSREVRVQDDGIRIEETFADSRLVTRSEQDTGDIRPWTSIARQFDDMGDMTLETVVFDNGRTRERSYDDETLTSEISTRADGDGPWHRLEKLFDAGAVTDEILFYRDGRKVSKTFDAGQQTQRTEEDLSDAYSWHMTEATYGSGGQVVSLLSWKDDGTGTTTTYDLLGNVSDVESWTWVV